MPGRRKSELLFGRQQRNAHAAQFLRHDDRKGAMTACSIRHSRPAGQLRRHIARRRADLIPPRALLLAYRPRSFILHGAYATLDWQEMG